MHKIPISTILFLASKNCSTKSLSNTISKILKMSFNTVESYSAERNPGLCKTLLQFSLS